MKPICTYHAPGSSSANVSYTIFVPSEERLKPLALNLLHQLLHSAPLTSLYPTPECPTMCLLSTSPMALRMR